MVERNYNELMPTREELIDAFAYAIGKREGFYNIGPNPTRAQRNRNPGNMRPWTGCLYPKDKDNFVVFPTIQEGWMFLKKQCDRNIFIRHLTFNEFFQGKFGVYAGFAPASDGNKPNAYAAFVVSVLSVRLGLKNVKVTDVVSEYCDPDTTYREEFWTMPPKIS